MRCVVSCSSTSFPWLVFFFAALLWGYMTHRHTGRWMWQGGGSVVSLNWDKCSYRSKLVSTMSMLLSSVLRDVHILYIYTNVHILVLSVIHCMQPNKCPCKVPKETWCEVPRETWCEVPKETRKRANILSFASLQAAMKWLPRVPLHFNLGLTQAWPLVLMLHVNEWALVVLFRGAQVYWYTGRVEWNRSATLFHSWWDLRSRVSSNSMW